MAQDNEYVQKLIAGRDREVAHRRDIAWVLAEKQNRGVLRAFDSNRNLIYAIAAKVYERGRKGSYELVAADF
ncbi:MAG: hypothetical protein WA728_28370 [Xanthobacteraceae bacterium]